MPSIFQSIYLRILLFSIFVWVVARYTVSSLPVMALVGQGAMVVGICSLIIVGFKVIFQGQNFKN